MADDATPFADRTEWWVNVDPRNRPLVVEVVEWLVDAVLPVSRVAQIDAYSDYRNELPDEVESAQSRLRDVGARRRRGDPGMAVCVRVDSASFPAVRAYLPWSIHGGLYADDRGMDKALWVHDCGHEVSARLTDEDARRFGTTFQGRAELETLVDARARRQRSPGLLARTIRLLRGQEP